MLTACVRIPISPMRQTTDKPYDKKNNLIIQLAITERLVITVFVVSSTGNSLKGGEKKALGLSRRVVTIKALLLVLSGNELKAKLNRLKNGLYIYLFSNLSYFCFY